MKVNDKESLMHGNEQRINPIAFYFVIQLFPYLVFILFLLFQIQNFQTTIITLIFLGISFWFIKNVNGFQLVGLRWKITLSGFDFYSKPNPFVPREVDSNTFWIGFFVFMFLWIIAFIITLFMRDFLLSFVCFIGFLLELFNLLMFMRSHKSAKSKLEHETLEMLQDEKINFEFVHSDDEEKPPEVSKNDNIENNSSAAENDGNNNVDNPDSNNDNQNQNQNINNESDKNSNEKEEFDLPTFGVSDDVNNSSHEEEPVHFDLVDDNDD